MLSSSSAPSWSAVAKENPKLACPSITAVHARNHHQSGTLPLPLQHRKTATFAASYSLVLQRGHEAGSSRARQLCTQPCASRHQRREQREQRDAPRRVQCIRTEAHLHAVGVVHVAAGQGGGLLPLLQRAQAHAALRGGPGVRGNAAGGECSARILFCYSPKLQPTSRATRYAGGEGEGGRSLEAMLHQRKARS
jgi:hypothetical protein